MQLARSGCSSSLAGAKQTTRPALPVLLAPMTSSTGRARNVEVAAKGKGKGRSRTTGPTMPGQMMQQQSQQVPEIDPDNEEFVLFARATKGSDFKEFVSISVVKGGSAANTLIKVMESEWGRKLYGRTLINNIAGSVYQDRDTLVKQLRKNIPPFANVAAKDFEFAFKIRDKRDPRDAGRPTNLCVLPAEAELAVQPLDKFRRFWTTDLLAAFTGGDAPAAAQ